MGRRAELRDTLRKKVQRCAPKRSATLRLGQNSGIELQELQEVPDFLAASGGEDQGKHEERIGEENTTTDDAIARHLDRIRLIELSRAAAASLDCTLELCFIPLEELRAIIPARRFHEMRTMPVWPEQTRSQVRSPTCSTFLTIFRSYFQSSKSPASAQTLTKSTTLASTERSPPMLNLTTSTSEKRLLHHCSHRRAKQKPVWHKPYHSTEESVLRGAPSVLANMRQPVVWPTKRKSSRELDDEGIKTTLQTQKKQLLTGARSEILKHENKANVTEDYIRGLKGQVESQE